MDDPVDIAACPSGMGKRNEIIVPVWRVVVRIVFRLLDPRLDHLCRVLLPLLDGKNLNPFRFGFPVGVKKQPIMSGKNILRLLRSGNLWNTSKQRCLGGWI